MEYQNKDFDTNRTVQYKEMRRGMGKHDDVFGPAWLPQKDKREITQEKQKLCQIYFKENM